MITKITGRLTHVFDDDARIQVGGLEYQVLVTEHVRRNLQTKVGEDITLCTLHYFEGNPVQQGRMLPRLLGFLRAEDLAFFDLFCSVDKIGVKKAIKALARPSRDIAAAIQREDAAWLTTLPGIGAASAEQIVTSLKRKVTRYAMSSPEGNGDVQSSVAGTVVEEAYQGLMVLGLSPLEARKKLDSVLSKNQFETVEEIIQAAFTAPKDTK